MNCPLTFLLCRKLLVSMKSRYAVTQRFTAGQNVILTLSGEDKEYSVSGITVFVKKKGLKYGDQFFAADGEEVSLT